MARKRPELEWYGDARPTGPDPVPWYEPKDPMVEFVKRLWRRLTRR